MAKGGTWLKRGVLVTFVLAAICCAVLALQVLCKESNIKAGITTLSFNFTIKPPDNPFVMPRALPERDILQSFQTEVVSVANSVATAIPGAISQVQSAANAAATAIPKAIEELIPKNCSLGTKQFCVGFTHNMTCDDLPLTLSDIVPEEVKSFLGDQLNDLQSLEGISTKVTSAYIQDCLIVGLVLMLILATIFFCSIFGRLFCIAAILLRLSVRSRVVIHLVLGMVCCIPLFIPAVVLYIFQSKTKELSSEIEMEKGEVSGLCLGALCCAIVMTLLTALVPAVI